MQNKKIWWIVGLIVVVVILIIGFSNMSGKVSNDNFTVGAVLTLTGPSGNWGELVKQYKNREYPLALGGYPHGFFGTLSHLIGYENLFMWYACEPELVHDILKTFTNLWITVYEEVLKQVEVDQLHLLLAGEHEQLARESGGAFAGADNLIGAIADF